MSHCVCPMRDGAHEANCGHVGEYEYVHCLGCDAPTWMCAVARSRCQGCREKYEASPEYQQERQKAFRHVFETIRRQAAEPPRPLFLPVSPTRAAEVLSIAADPTHPGHATAKELAAGLCLTDPGNRDNPVIGTVGEIQPDGSAELILTEAGNRIYGDNIRLVIVDAAPPAADEPVIAKGNP